jgi:3-isopropylmalate/(R)-2-methylmalate dehydratase small subunit
MEAFTVHRGIAAPLRRSDVDTDVLFPGRFGARNLRTGHADALFADWRQDPEFVLNREPYRRATILVAGENFGTGSSREHAVWALRDYGFRVVISPRFGDIFRGNALMAGLLAITLPAADVERLWQITEQEPEQQVEVDLEQLRVRARGLDRSFELDADVRDRMLAGLDQIGATMRFENDIAAYESSRRAARPTSFARTVPGPAVPGPTVPRPA